MKHITLIMLLLTLGLSIWALDDTFAGLQTISLAQARDLALSQNAAYQAQKASLESARWSKQASLSSFLPSLSLGANVLWMDPAATIQAGNQNITLNNDFRTISLSLSQPLYMGGKLWQAYKIASAGEDIAELNLESKRLSVLSEVESKYLSVLQLKSVYGISLAELDAARRNLELAELKLASGILSRADILRFQSSLANKEVALLQTETALQLALQDFANYLALPEPSMPEELTLQTDSELLSSLQGFDLSQTRLMTDRALQVAMQRNLSGQILDKTLELSDRALKIAKGSFLPSVILTGSRKYEENGLDRYKFTASNQIMLNASIPLLPGLGNYANLRKAQEDKRKTMLDYKSATDGIKLGVQAATVNWVSAAKQLKNSQIALSYSTELYEQLQERFRQNMLSSLELIDAELMLSAARMNQTNAYFNYLKSSTALMQLLALEDPSLLETLLFAE